MWNDLWENHRGAAVGIVCGFVLGLVYLFFGFWNMLAFAFLIYLGFYIGRKVDRREELFPWVEWYRWLNERWRMFR